MEIEVFQGENEVAEENVPLGSYRVEDLPPAPAGSVQIEVHFDFDVNGILTVTTTEKGKGQQGTLVVNNAGIQRLSSHELKQAKADLAALFESDELLPAGLSMLHDLSSTIDATTDDAAIAPELAALCDRAQQTLSSLEPDQAEELQVLLDQIDDALAEGETTSLADLQEELSDFLYYVTNPQP